MNNQTREDILALMTQYKQVNSDRSEVCNLLDIQIENLLETRNLLAEPFDQKIAELENMIRLPMMDLKESFKCPFGNITYRKGAVRRSWNLDALDMICNAEPDIKKAIWPFREEKTGEPSITIKVGL